MKTTSTPQSKTSFYKGLMLLLTIFVLALAQTSFAHTINPFVTSGCSAGSNITVDAVVTNTTSAGYYHWQFKDNSGIWKNFINGSNTINSVSFTVSGATANNSPNDAPLLTIQSATTALENVQVRCLIADGADPSGAGVTPVYASTVYGGDITNAAEGKGLRLHVYSPATDCGGTTPGCIGNVLTNANGYYGGFEAKTFDVATQTYTDNNFGANAGATAFMVGTGAAHYQTYNNPFAMSTGFGAFAPHTGNYQMEVQGSAVATDKVWYKTVTVSPGTTYSFCVWAARVDATDPTIQLNVAGTEVAFLSLSSQATGSWVQLCGNYTVPAGVTSVEISVKDKNAGTGGNNYTLDDICFRQIATSLNLGNFVWNDQNNNGVQDAGEPVISGVTVNLYKDANADNLPDGAAIATTTTNAGGVYGFSGLAAGNYIAGVVLPAGYAAGAITATSASPNNDNNTDNNGVTTVSGEVRSNFITLSAGVEPSTDGDGTDGNLTLDFGLKGTGSIGDFVWYDLNANGIQDAGEPGIAGATVLLTYPNISTLTTTTDANGNYLFSNLAPGTYSVTFPTTSGFAPSQANVGADDTKDSDPIGGTAGGIVLTAGQNNTTIDAGFQCNTMILGNFVWYDQNNNGIQDAGEAGISGAVISLYRDANADNIPDGAAIATTTSSAGGAYSFTGLTPGNYIVGVIIPSGYAAGATTATSSNPNNDNNTDNNGVTTVSGELRSNYITLSTGGEPVTDGDGANGNLTLDFGLKGTGSIGDFVWNDLNTNGIQDAGEPGIAGATVVLTYPNGTTVTTTTNANGLYTFSNLAPGTYSVTFTTPPGYSPSLSNIGANDAIDSDPVGGVVSGIVLAAGQNNTTVDAAFFTPTGSIGDRVWNDTNKNGVQDGGETGVASVTVTLYDNAGNILATTVTDAYGNYVFPDLPVSSAGINYQVRFSLPAEYVFSPQSQGANITLDSDPNTATGRTGNISLTSANKNRTDIDAGIYFALPARIGDFIWNDLNKNGIQDPGEPGIAGVTVTLYNNSAVAIRTTVTDNNGFYQFTDLPAGTYTLGITPPVGYILSAKDQTTDDKDSDFDPATFKTTAFTLLAGAIDLSFDGGLQVTATTKAAVGDKVWNDINNNGLQDNNEPGVAGVTVELYTSANILVATMVTDAFGMYIFNDLVPGTYYVKFSNIPAGYNFVAANVGGNANVAIDSDPNPATGITPAFTLVGDQVRVTVDAGIHNPAVSNNNALGDFVWYDLNKNGMQDAGEAGVPAVTVILYNATTGAVIKTTVTDINGMYLFTDLPNGSYSVGFTNLPAGYKFTIKDAGNDLVDSDVDPNSGRTGIYTLAGSTNRTADAGIVSNPGVLDSKGSIGDRVWNDINNNGIQEAGEPGVTGVIVTLYDLDGLTVIATTTTDGLGNYIFTNLNAGNYIVGFSGLPSGYTFVNANVGADDNKDSDPNTTTGKSGAIILAAGEVNLSIDAGIIAGNPKSVLGDKVWFDVNGDGIQDPGEAGVEGISVKLYTTSNTLLKTTTTDANGNYLFTDLDPGSYVIGFSNLPSGYTPTTQNASGSTAATNSDANASGLTGIISVALSSTDLTWDMGIVTTTRAAIGDYVWSDVNGNGIQDANEPPVAGITVILYDNTATAIGTTVTDGNGFYIFNNLLAGTYAIGFSNLPINSGFTTKNAAGSTADNNSDVNAGTGRTDAFTLSAGQVRTDVDAGLVSNFAAVGDYVWYDKDANGRQDPGELPVAGTTVTVFDANNIQVASAVTNGNGYYLINNIPVPVGGQTFIIGFTDMPVNIQAFTIKNSAVSNSNNNSDANPATGKTDPFTLNPGQIRLDIDAGIITDNGGPLPIRLTTLQGVYANGVSHLSWATLSQQNFSHFEVEFATDGINFSGIGKVSGAGNSNVRIDYNLIHRLPVAGANYYRLKMIDINGNFTYSNTIVLNVTVKGFNITGVYPNPFVNEINISIASESKSAIAIRIFDNSGRLVYNQQAVAQRGTSLIPVTGLNVLAAGNYIIEVRTTDSVFTQKLVK